MQILTGVVEALIVAFLLIVFGLDGDLGTLTGTEFGKEKTAILALVLICDSIVNLLCQSCGEKVHEANADFFVETGEDYAEIFNGLSPRPVVMLQSYTPIRTLPMHPPQMGIISPLNPFLDI